MKTEISLEETSKTTNIRRYPNYLGESRTLQNENQKSHSVKTVKNFRNYIRETKNILNKSNYSEAEKLDRIKMVAHRMESQNY